MQRTTVSGSLSLDSTYLLYVVQGHAAMARRR
jgi:hypothetical protein